MLHACAKTYSLVKCVMSQRAQYLMSPPVESFQRHKHLVEASLNFSRKLNELVLEEAVNRGLSVHQQHE